MTLLSDYDSMCAMSPLPYCLSFMARPAGQRAADAASLTAFPMLFTLTECILYMVEGAVC